MLRSPEPILPSHIIKKKLNVGNMHVSHKPGHGSIFHMGVMLIDGIGLGMIAVCTVFEGIEDYFDALAGSSKENPETMLFFVAGLILATFGLLFLIFHAASFEAVHDFEYIGMAMLTVAPLVNMCAWTMFDSGLDPTHFYNRQWLATEVIEVTGMTTLCISFIDADRYVVLVIELVGFAVLMIAAMCTVNIHSDRILPEVILRTDHIHIFDTCGLFLLCLVSCAQCHMKGLTIEYNHTHPTPQKGHSGHSASHRTSPMPVHHPDSDKGTDVTLTHRLNEEFSGNSDSDSDA